MISVEEGSDSPFLSAFGLDAAGNKSAFSGSSSPVSPEIAGYLTQLSSYGLERLTREPERLAEEKSAILEQTKELASQNYKTFIETAECSKEIFEDFVDVENRLGNLLEEKLPACSSSCKDFQTQAEEISQKRRLNNQILQKHSQLLEILEVPQLIDTCVKNGHFDEALELANYVRRLEKKHGSQIPLVRSILCEVRNCIQSMVGQLISQLRTAQLTLPVCLKVIGHIRRLDVFSETELRVLFLNARDSWFQSTLASIPKDDAYTHVIKTVDATRVHLFDIVTQYKAIFTDDTDVRTGGKRSTPGAGISAVLANDSSILYSWILEKVDAFLESLRSDLASPSVEQRLDAVFNQCMYFGLSFGRVGIDLRPLLIPIFEETSVRFLRSGLDRGLKTFEDELRLLSFTSSSVGVAGSNSVLALSLDLSASLGGDLESSTSSSSGLVASTSQPPPPPLSLLEFPPLASLYNDILNALNDFRSTATLNALFPTKSALSSHLHSAGRICVSVFDSLKNSFTESETENFRRLALLFVETLVPNVVKCFKCLFPSQQVAEALGIGIGQVHKSDIYLFDVEGLRKVFPLDSFPNLAVVAESVVETGEMEVEDSAKDVGSSEAEEVGASENAGEETKEVAASSETEASNLMTDESQPEVADTNVESLSTIVEQQDVAEDVRASDAIVAETTPTVAAVEEKRSMVVAESSSNASSTMETVAAEEVRSTDLCIEESHLSTEFLSDAKEDDPKTHTLQRELTENEPVAMSLLELENIPSAQKDNGADEVVATSSETLAVVAPPKGVTVSEQSAATKPDANVVLDPRDILPS